MKKILLPILMFVSVLSFGQGTNTFKSIVLKNFTDSTGYSSGWIWYNQTYKRFSFVENGSVKHFLTGISPGNLSPLFTTATNGNSSAGLSFSLNTQSANSVFAGPSSGSASAPTFRSLVTADIPDLSSVYIPVGTVISGQYGGTGVANTGKTITLGGNLTTSGAYNTTFSVSGSNTITFPNSSITVARTDAGQTFTGTQTFSSAPVLTSSSTVGYVWTATNTSGAGAWQAPSATGTVTSFSSGNLSPLFTTSVANSTTTPALSFSLNTQSTNTFFAGPSSGSASTPTFRSIVKSDVPTLDYWPLNGTATIGSTGTTINNPSTGGGITIQGDNVLFITGSQNSPVVAGSSGGIFVSYDDGTSVSGNFEVDAANGTYLVTNANKPSAGYSSLQLLSGNVIVASTITNWSGAVYDIDYSAHYTNRSLVDQGYVLSTKTFTGKQTFTPTSSVAGMNVGLYAGDPSGVTNGDIWYNSTSNLLKARINGATVSLGAAGGGGTVTSFSSGNLSPLFTTSVANSTTTPALSFTLSTQSANTVFAGPSSGSSAAPTFRSLVKADVPTLDYWPLSGTATAGTVTINSGNLTYNGVATFNTSGGGFFVSYDDATIGSGNIQLAPFDGIFFNSFENPGLSGNVTTISMINGSFDITSNVTNFGGLSYTYDYSAHYTDRSLIDRGYALSAKTYNGIQTFFTSTTGSASINLPDGSNPTSPNNNDIWGNSNHLFARLNGVTYQLDQPTVVGTVTTGTWNGSVIAGQYGGTGVSNTGKTITLGGNLTTSGAYNTTFSVSGSNTITFPNASITVARTDAGQTFTGTQTFSSAPVLTTSSTTGYVWTATNTSGAGAWQAASGGGITNSAANNELMKSDGTNAVSSGLFSSTSANITLGSGSISGSRIIAVSSSTTNANLTLTPQGIGAVKIGGSILQLGSDTDSNSSSSITANGTVTNISVALIAKGSGGATINGGGGDVTLATAPATGNNGLTIHGASGITTVSGIAQGSGGGLSGYDVNLKAGQGDGSGNNNGGNLYLNGGDLSGTGTVGNIGLFSTSGSFGSGSKVLFIGNTATAPSGTISGGGVLFVKSADTNPYWRSSSTEYGVLLHSSTTTAGRIPYFNGTNSGVLTSGAGLFYVSSQFGVSGYITASYSVVSPASPVLSLVSGSYSSITASTEKNDYLFDYGSHNWATGNITTQRFFYVKPVTVTFTGASTITNAYGAYFEPATASTNATITNNWALGLNGSLSILAGKVQLAAGTTSSPPLVMQSGSLSTSAVSGGIEYLSGTYYFTSSTPTRQMLITFKDNGGTASTRVPFGNTASTFADSPNFTFTSTTNLLSVLNLTLPQSALSSAWIPVLNVTPGAHTSMTASTEFPDVKINSATHTWAAGTISTQRWFYVKQPTIAFASASTLTNGYTFYAESPAQGTNATITNAFAAGFSGNIAVSGSSYFGSVTTAPVSTVDISGSLGDGAFTGISGSTTLTNAQCYIKADATSGAITITLPSASGATNRIYTILKVDSGANTVTISTTASGNKVISTQYSGFSVKSDGTSWYTVGSF